jgi:tRNA1Val (adenine37-N6)-methyltransferase
MNEDGSLSLLLNQPPRGAGYRVNADAFLLARFARPSRALECVCDLGAGVGAVALALLHVGAVRRALLVEIDRHAAAFAAQNVARNGFASRAEIVVGDVSAVALARRGEASLVVCNPPYVAPGRGRAPSVEARARARMGSLATFAHAARLVAGRRAKVCFVYPAQETVTLLTTLRTLGLEPKRLVYVHPKAGTSARVVLVEAKAGKPGGLLVEPPIFDATR